MGGDPVNLALPHLTIRPRLCYRVRLRLLLCMLLLPKSETTTWCPKPVASSSSSSPSLSSYSASSPYSCISTQDSSEHHQRPVPSDQLRANSKLELRDRQPRGPSSKWPVTATSNQFLVNKATRFLKTETSMLEPRRPRHVAPVSRNKHANRNETK